MGYRPLNRDLIVPLLNHRGSIYLGAGSLALLHALFSTVTSPFHSAMHIQVKFSVDTVTAT